MANRATGLRAMEALTIALLATIAYWPSLSGRFLLDDNTLVTDNSLVLAPDGLVRMWFSAEPIDYWPATNTSFWIEWRLWGMDPTGYHVTNLVLHIASALLLWAILERLAIPGAWLAALLFAIHPVNVDSVAWISQRKNTLSMFFFLLSVLWYLKADASSRREPSGGKRRRTGTRREPSGPGAPGARLAGPGVWYWLSVSMFILAMLSKGSVAVLPMLLLLIAWWQRGGIDRRDLVRTAPLFLVAIVLAAVNVWFQTHGQGAIRIASFSERLLGAGAVVWFYLYKALVPLNLSFVYRQWSIDPDSLRSWLPLIAAVMVTAILIWQRDTRFGRPLLFAWLFFAIALAPVLGFTDVGFMQFALVADRYQHIAIIAVVTLAAAACRLLYQRGGTFRPASLTVATATVGALVLLTWRQSSLYADPVALYRSALVDNPSSQLLLTNLGIELNGRKEYREAREVLELALRLGGPLHEANVRNNLAAAFIGEGEFDKAAGQLNELVSRSAASAETQLNLGVLAARHDRYEDAIKHFEAALRLRPAYAEAHSNLTRALTVVGRPAAAIEHGQAALRLNPHVAVAHSNYGYALFELGQPSAAMEEFKEAVRLDPNYVFGYLNVAETYARAGRFAEAVSTVRQALAVAHSSNQTGIIGEVEKRLKGYEAKLSKQLQKPPSD